MMYLLLNVAFLVIIGFVLAIVTRQKPQKALWLTLIIVLIITAIFDSLFIIYGIFEYAIDTILGVYIWKAPIEDFAYTIASVAMVGLLWEYFEKREVSHEK